MHTEGRAMFLLLGLELREDGPVLREGAACIVFQPVRLARA